MKSLTVTLALSLACAGAIAADDMKGMAMKDKTPSQTAKDTKSIKHTAKGTVKKVDAKAGTVSLEHEAIKTLNWPAMTMTFKVQDKALLDTLKEGRKVEAEFEERGKDYVITSAKAG